MGKVSKILIVLVILGAILYQFQDDIRIRLLPFIQEIAMYLGIKNLPCEDSIIYTLGTFDTRFNISQSYFLSALAEAEVIWEKPFGKELFAYRENDKEKDVLKVNLVYDFRQEATNKLASLGIIVKENRTTYDSLKDRFFELKSEFEKIKNNYEKEIEIFNDRQNSFREQVKYWNAQGGALQNEYDKLEAERSALNIELSRLRTLQTKTSEMGNEINALVVILNNLANKLNISVEKYNTVGVSRGESFEEGVYSSNGINKEIDIYEFSNRRKLVRVLAHELGHALGLEHVKDPKAIMYELNQDNSETLTKADFDALKIRCRVK